jgi:hypothetical protein
MKKPILKTSFVETTEYVDVNTGELIDTSVKKHTYLAGSEGDFFIGYAALEGALMGFTAPETRIFGYCLRFAKGIHFDISKKVRLHMSEIINVNERTILNTLPSLEEKGILYKHKTGLYQLNPRYAFRGSTSTRKGELKAIIELGCKDC